MSKPAKIAITIGLMVVWALLRSLLEYSDFPLPVLTFVFIIIILGLWAFGKTPEASETDRPIKRVDSERQSNVVGAVLSDEKMRKAPLPHIQVKSESEPIIAKQSPSPSVPSNMSIVHLNKDYVLSLLREKCHPKQFMQPYDYDKVNIANRLYTSLKDDCSLEDLKDILSEATEKLQVSIDTSQIVAELCKVCSPEKFMDPYDAEKIAEANELYSKILANNSNIIDLVMLKEEAISRSILIVSQHKAVESPHDVVSCIPNVPDMPKIPTVIVNYWKSSSGLWIRLVQYKDSELLQLEEKEDDTWKSIATLVKTSGNTAYGGFGSEYVNSRSRMVTYSIHRWSGKLVERISGEVSREWKYDDYPYAALELGATKSKMTKDDKEKDEITRNYYNYGSS